MVSQSVLDIVKINPNHVISAGKKQRDFQYHLQNFKLRLKKIKANFALTAGPLSKEKQTLNKQLSNMDSVSKDLVSLKSLYKQATVKFGDNKAAQKLIKEFDSFIQVVQQEFDDSQKVINKMAKTSVPKELLNSKAAKELVKYLQRNIAKTKGMSAGKRSYSVDKIDKGLRFAVFYEIKGVLTEKKKKIDIFIVLVQDMYKPVVRNGKFTGTTGDVFLSMTTHKTRVTRLPDGYSITDRKDIANAMAVLARNLGLYMFAKPLNQEVLDRKIKKNIGSSKLNVFDKTFDVKVDGAKLFVRTPRNKVIFNKDAPQQKWTADLYVDMKRILGLPLGGDRKSQMMSPARRTTDRLKLESYKKAGNFVIFKFHVLPISPNDMLQNNPVNMKRTVKGLPPADSTSMTPHEGIELLRKAVDDELKKGPECK